MTPLLPITVRSLSDIFREKLIIYLLPRLLSDTPPTPPSTALLLPWLLEGIRRSRKGSPRLNPNPPRLSTTRLWTLLHPPSQGECAAPAARCGSRSQPCAALPAASARARHVLRRWRERASERAPPPRTPQPFCWLPPLLPSPPLALQQQPRPLRKRRKLARSGWPGAQGSGRAPGKHSAVFLSVIWRVTSRDVGCRQSPSPSAGMGSEQPRGGSLG
jgi:hypothetical protein